ncbi:hypothetical protein SEA_MAGRITTE_242 [Microbacterium phage Magritte]|nr:hypothetical protein SEA_MAGRITTE_242 [Microbacterium phage Magritte]
MNERLSWMPSPDSADVISRITYWYRKIQAQDPKNWLWEYRANMPEDQFIYANEDAFYDGKARVFLNPKHKDKIEQFLASLADEDV